MNYSLVQAICISSYIDKKLKVLSIDIQNAEKDIDLYNQLNAIQTILKSISIDFKTLSIELQNSINKLIS